MSNSSSPETPTTTASGDTAAVPAKVNLRDLLGLRKQEKIVDVPVQGIAGVTSVKVKRISAATAIQVGRDYPEESSLGKVLETILDESEQPLFNSIEEVRACDWQLYLALIEASNAVNGINLEASAKK